MNTQTPKRPNTRTLGTRGSRLARWQARRVQEALEARGAAVRLETITTRGDRVQDVPLSQLGDEGVFTKEIDRALLDGRIDLAVHSLKDLPSRLPEGIRLAAVSERASPFDAFVAHPSFDGRMRDLPEAAVVATSSLRRTAQLKAWRPDLNIVPVRGNVDTRLEKLAAADWHGMVLAVAGLARMGWADRIREEIAPEVMVPAAGQGALAVTCRAGDEETAHLLREAVHDEPTAVAARGERAFMQRLGAGCQVPVGVWGRLDEAGRLVLGGCIAALDGVPLLREQRVCSPAEAETAGTALAEALLQRGGREILEAIRQGRRAVEP